MKRSLKLLMSALTALILPAFGWAELPTAAWTWVGSGGTDTGTTLDSGEKVYTVQNKYIDMDTNGVTVPANGFTFSFWTKRAGSNWRNYAGFSDTTAGLMIQQNNTAGTMNIYGSGAMLDQAGDQKFNLAADPLQLVTFVSKEGTLYTYVNGTLNNTFTPSATAWPSFSQNGQMRYFALGSAPNTSGANAGNGGCTTYIADARVYNVAFTADQVKELYDDYATRAAAMAYQRTVTEAAAWSAADAWTLNGEKAEAPADAKPAHLTVNADSTITMNAVANVSSLTIDGTAKATFVGENALNASSTTVNTNVDVSQMTAEADLGAVTIAKDKVLTGLASKTITSSLAGEGTYELGAATADTEYAPSWAAASTTPIKWTKGKLTFATGSNGSGYPKNAPVTVTGADAQMVLKTALDTTGYNGGSASLTIADGAKLVVEARDTFNRPLILNNGHMTLSGDNLDSGRAFDLYSNSSITSSGTSSITGANATANDYGDNTVGSGIIAIRRANLEIAVNDGTLSCYAQFGGADGYGNAATGVAVKKTGSGTLALYRAAANNVPVQVNAGTLKLVNDGGLTNNSYTIAQDATLAVSVIADKTKTMANTFNGPGKIVKQDAGTLDLGGATFGETSPAFEVSGGTLIIPAGKEGAITIPAEGTLKLVIADTVDSYDASETVTGEGTFMFVDSTGEQITEGVEGKVFTRPASTTPVCFDGMETTYTSIAAAIEAKCTYIMMTANTTEDVTLPNGTMLYTYGVTITGDVTIQSGATLAVYNGGTIDGAVTFDNGANLVVGSGDFKVSGAVTFPTEGTFNLTMPSTPTVGAPLAFITSTAAETLKDDAITVGKLNFTVGETVNDTDYKLVTTASTNTYDVATVATPACELDGTVYTSLTDAIAAAFAEGYTGDRIIKLSESIALASTLTIDIGDENELTIDLNGCTISNSDMSANVIIIQSGTLKLTTSNLDAYMNMVSTVTTAAIVVGTETSEAPALIIGEKVQVSALAPINVVNVVKGSIGGAGSILAGGDAEVLTMAADTTIDATQGILTISQGSIGARLGLPETGTVNVTVADDAKVDDVILTCDTTGITADKFTVSNESLGVAVGEGQLTLVEVTPAEPIAQVGEETYTSLTAALNAVTETDTTITLLTDVTVAAALTVDKSVTLAIGEHTLTIPAPQAITVAADAELKVTCGTGGLVVGGTIAVNGTLDVSELAYGPTGLVSGQSGSLAIGATGTVKLMSSWNTVSVNWMQANSASFFSGTVSGATVLQGEVASTYNGTLWLKDDTTVSATITANGQTYTEAFATLSAALAEDPSVVTLLKDTEVAEDVELTLPVAGAYTVTVKNGVTLDIAAPTFTNDATKTFADGVNIATEEGATVTLTSGGGYFSITGAGTVQAVGNANFIYGLGSVKNTISANIEILADKAFNVRAWNNCAPLGGGNITVNGTITADGGDSGTLKLKVASGKTLTATSAIGVPVVLADGAILDAPVTITGAVTQEGAFVIDATGRAVGDTVLTCTTANLNLAKVVVSGMNGVYVTSNESGTALVLTEVTVPDDTTADEKTAAFATVAELLPTTVVTEITNPGVASIITSGLGADVDENGVATFTYEEFKVSEIAMDGNTIKVTVTVGDLVFATGVTVTLVDLNGEKVGDVDADGTATFTKGTGTQLFKAKAALP